MITASQLKARHLEFASIPDLFVTEKIEKAYQALNEETISAQYDDAAEWLACHYIAMSPMGGQARLDVQGDPSTSIYYENWLKIAKPHGRAWRI